MLIQAFLIAFTSDFLPKLLYKYEFKSNLQGYTNFTLAYAPNGTMTEECRSENSSYLLLINVNFNLSISFINLSSGIEVIEIPKDIQQYFIGGC